MLLPSGAFKFTGRGGGNGRAVGAAPRSPAATGAVLTGRSPDSRRVPGTPHRLPTGNSGSGCRLCLRDAACAVYRCGGSAGMAIDSRTGFPISPGSRPGHLSSRVILGRRPEAGQAAVDGRSSAPQCGVMANSARLDAALAAAASAADADPRALRGVNAARAKADGSPVTEADIAAEQAIRAIVAGALSRRTGSTARRSAAERMDAEHLWIVDPIDGTKSFVRQYPMFSTQIAVMRRGRLELGVSSAPVYGETAWAERGRGAWLDGAPLAVSRIARSSRRRCRPATCARSQRAALGRARPPGHAARPHPRLRRFPALPPAGGRQDRGRHRVGHQHPRHRGADRDRRGSGRARHRSRRRADRPRVAEHPRLERRAARDDPRGTRRARLRR